MYLELQAWVIGSKPRTLKAITIDLEKLINVEHYRNMGVQERYPFYSGLATHWAAFSFPEQWENNYKLICYSYRFV